MLYGILRSAIVIYTHKSKIYSWLIIKLSKIIQIWTKMVKNGQKTLKHSHTYHKVLKKFLIYCLFQLLSWLRHDRGVKDLKVVNSNPSQAKYFFKLFDSEWERIIATSWLEDFHINKIGRIS